jgi:hypothetical protein
VIITRLSAIAFLLAHSAFAIFPWPVASAACETCAYLTWRTGAWNTAGGTVLYGGTGTTQVRYGLTSSYGSNTILDATQVFYHEATITGLNPGTVYHYQVVSTDSGGNTAVSGDYTFTTLAAPTGTVKTVKPTGGDYASVQACATAASAGWVCEVYSGGAVDTSVIAVSSSHSGTSGNPVSFIAHDAVALPGFNLADNASYITIKGFELTTAAYGSYQSCGNIHAITLGNNSTSDIIQSNYIHNIYSGGFVRLYASTNTTSGIRVVGNIMAFAMMTNQNPPFSHPCGTPSGGQIGILLAGNNMLIDGNDIQEADHLIELTGSYDVARRNVAHDTYAADWGASNASDHVDFFHPAESPNILGLVSIHHLIEDNLDYNRNDLNEHFLLDEAPQAQSSQSLGTGDGSKKTFSGTVSLGSDRAIAPFSVVVMVCNSACSSGGGTASVYDNGFGAFKGNGTGTVTYSGGSAGTISATFTAAPANGVTVKAYYALLLYGAHDRIIRGNLIYNVSGGFGGGEGGVSGMRMYNNTFHHAGYIGNSQSFGGIGLYGGSGAVNPTGNWVGINNLFDDSFVPNSGPPWGWTPTGTAAFITPPEYLPGYSMIYTPSCDPGCPYTAYTTGAPGMIVGQNPNFVSIGAYNFNLTSNSLALNAGTNLTTVASTDTGSGTLLILNDAGFFQDGYGIRDVNSDCIAITTVSNVVCIAAGGINYQTNTITLASPVTRHAGDPVWLAKDSTGSEVAPNIGSNFLSSAPAPPTGLTAVPQ